jgi:hypothetical protein
MVLANAGARIVLVVVCVVASQAAFSGESENAVVDEIVAAHKRIRNEFRPTKVIQSFDEIKSPGKPKVANRAEFLYRIDNVLVSTGLEIWAANDDYAFRIRRATPDSDWSIVDVEATSDSGTAPKLA